MRTLQLLRTVLADANLRRAVLLSGLVLVPAATLLPAAAAPGLGMSGGPLRTIALVLVSILAAGLLVIAASLPVAHLTVGLGGLPRQELPSRAVAAAVGGLVGLAAAAVLLGPLLLIVLGFLPFLSWPFGLVGLVGCGWLMLFPAAAADVGPLRAPKAVWQLMCRNGAGVSLRVGGVAAVLWLAGLYLMRVGPQDPVAVWLVATAACLAPAALGVVWHAAKRTTPALRLAGVRDQNWQAVSLDEFWKLVSVEVEEPMEAPQTRSSAAAISSGRPFGSGRA